MTDRIITIKKIVDFVCDESKKDVRSKTKAKRIPILKQYCFLLCYKYVSYATLEDIGKELGVSHSNVHTQLNKLLDIFTVDKNSKKEFYNLEKKIIQKFPKEESTREFYLTHNNFKKITLCRKLDETKNELKKYKNEVRMLKHGIKKLSKII